MPHEIELKLRLAPADIWRLRRHPALKDEARRRAVASRLDAVYYDTPDFSLCRAGVAVRLRQAGGRWVQTVKTAGSVQGGLHQRPEWEYPSDGRSLDFGPVDDARVRDLLREAEAGGQLAPRFTTTFARSARLLEFPGGDIVELCLDQGEVRAGDRAESFCELELELKHGAPGRLFELALALQADIALVPEPASKAARGYRLAGLPEGGPVKSTASPLRRRMSAGEGLWHAIERGLIQLQANETGVLAGTDPEFVHQARVALRRLRAVTGLFSPIVPPPGLISIRDELRWLAGEFNDARNWDVFVDETLVRIQAGFRDIEALQSALHATAVARRQDGYARARAALGSARYARLLLQLGALLATPPWMNPSMPSSDGTPEQEACMATWPVARFARRALGRRHRRLIAAGAAAGALSPAALHELRIDCKKQRYAGELFAPLFGAKRARRYLAALAAVQDLLGAMNDCATAEGLVDSCSVATADPQAGGVLRGWLRGAFDVRREALAGAWRAFMDEEPFWGK